MNHTALREELLTDPLSRGYASMGNYEASVSLNTPNRTQLVRGKILTELGVLDFLGPDTGDEVLTAIEAAATQSSLLTRVVRNLRDKGIDFGLESTQLQIDLLVSGGVITEDAGESLKSYGKKTLARWEELNLGRQVNARDVEIART